MGGDFYLHLHSRFATCCYSKEYEVVPRRRTNVGKRGTKDDRYVVVGGGGTPPVLGGNDVSQRRRRRKKRKLRAGITGNGDDDVIPSSVYVSFPGPTDACGGEEIKWQQE